MTEVIQIPVDQINPQTLQRPVSEHGIAELASSIRALGVLEPLLVARHNQEFFLLAGQRRLLAAQQINLATVPCIVIPADQEKALAISLHENLFRENLTCVDEAMLYAYLRDKLKYANRAIAKMLSKSEPYVSQRLALLSWDPLIVDALKSDTISFSVARELMQVRDTTHRRYLIKHAVEDGINYRTARLWVQQWRQSIIPPVQEKEESPGPPGQPLQTSVVADCYWCERSVKIDDICNVFLCDKCFEELAKAKVVSRQKKP